ncbi:MAG: flagellar motor protein MotB [Sphingomonas sp.]|jgi:flagellar motor protein MotB|uniref:flagellar motor protein MotB n=1 Tax=Sphingomonas sp. TaxID=28214 RepID=UPI003563C5CB
MMSRTFDDDLPDLAPTRPIWLMTLADLALLLIGFFVLLQASQQLDRAALARGLRAGFGVRDTLAPSAIPTPEPMAVSAGAMRGFAPGSAALPTTPDGLIAWARDAARDTRVTLRVAGAVDGSPADVDPLTGSGAVLAADRARAVASALLLGHAVPANRITIAAARPGQRGVTVSTGFAGGRQ